MIQKVKISQYTLDIGKDNEKINRLFNYRFCLFEMIRFVLNALFKSEASFVVLLNGNIFYEINNSKVYSIAVQNLVYYFRKTRFLHQNS